MSMKSKLSRRALRWLSDLNDAVRRSVNVARLASPVSESWVARSVSATWLLYRAWAIRLNACASSPSSSRRATSIRLL